MTKEKAFVFDTNFILQYKDLVEVVSILEKEFSVYVPQVSIEERLSQHYVDLRERYGELEGFQKKHEDIARIELTKTFDEKYKTLKNAVNKKYTDLFQKKIIPFTKDAVTFEAIWDRVHKKEPPFRTAKGASDKGFKDALLWLSIIRFFKESGEGEVVFLTNDNNFLDNATMLEQEFKNATKKEISIKNNKHYEFVIGKSEEVSVAPVVRPIANVQELRKKIVNTIENICNVIAYSSNGFINYEDEKAFILREKISEAQMEKVLGELHEIVTANYLHQEIDADRIFHKHESIEGHHAIPIENLEAVVELYNEVKTKMPDYLAQFLTVAADIFNRNYEEISYFNADEGYFDDDGELPF